MYFFHLKTPNICPRINNYVYIMDSLLTKVESFLVFGGQCTILDNYLL